MITDDLLHTLRTTPMSARLPFLGASFDMPVETVSAEDGLVHLSVQGKPIKGILAQLSLFSFYLGVRACSMAMGRDLTNEEMLRLVAIIQALSAKKITLCEDHVPGLLVPGGVDSKLIKRGMSEVEQIIVSAFLGFKDRNLEEDGCLLLKSVDNVYVVCDEPGGNYLTPEGDWSPSWEQAQKFPEYRDAIHAAGRMKGVVVNNEEVSLPF